MTVILHHQSQTVNCKASYLSELLRSYENSSDGSPSMLTRQPASDCEGILPPGACERKQERGFKAWHMSEDVSDDFCIAASPTLYFPP
jgi:hypothetical protein